jgi:hypothetical protein
LDFSDSTCSFCCTREPVAVVRWLEAFFPVIRVPSFMDVCINSPEVSIAGSIISLKDEVVDKWSIVIQVVDEELDGIEHSYEFCLERYLNETFRGRV